MLTKILIAKAENGDVTVESGKVPDAQILSSGKAASNGILIISEDNKIYIAIPMNSITQLISAVDDFISKITLASLGAPMQGWSAPPTLPTDVLPVKQALAQLKENLQ